MKEKYRYSLEWINKLEKKIHWQFYWHQHKLMQEHLNKNFRIAEIGVGSKFTYNYLQTKGYNIKSIDIDENKNPDILGNIVTCSPDIIEFETIIAFNIFEHIPYNEFLATIEKFKNKKVKQLFIGLPINRKTIIDFKLRVGRYFNKQFSITIPKRKITTENHHWELGYKNYTTEKLYSDLSNIGYRMENHFNFKLQSFFYFYLNK